MQRVNLLVLLVAGTFACVRDEGLLYSVPDGGSAASEGGSTPAPDGALPDAAVEAAVDAAATPVRCNATKCATGYECVDDLSDDCDPAGVCPGRCIPAASGDDCGGIAGLTCKKGQWCDYDQCGGADILGKCRPFPTVLDCPPVATTTCPHALCDCGGTSYGCDPCAANRAGFTVQRCK